MYNKQQLYNSLLCNYPPLFAQANPALAQDEYTARQIKQFKNRAEEYLAKGIPPLTYNDFSAYFINGNRSLFQSPYFARRGHLLVFSVLAKETGEEKYITGLSEIIWALCSDASWCVPAHFLNQHDEDIQPRDYSTHLDLFSCETAFALAEALALCHGLIPAQLAQLAMHNIQVRIFQPFENDNALYRFERMANNWSAVCAGAIGGAAMYLIKDNVRLCNILHRCMSCMSVYLNSFGDDGVCAEGVDYWNYGFGFFVSFAQLLKTRTNEALDLFKLDKVKAIANAGTAFYLGKSATISFSDGSENGAYRMGLMCYLGQLYGFPLPAPIKDAAADTLLDDCYRYCTAIRDLYTPHTIDVVIGGGGTTWLADSQWLIVRDDNACLVAKAGHNNESHNHNDCGSFIFTKSCQHLICDLGAGMYDKAYFSDTRYEILVNRSMSHNIALINGKEQCQGEKYAARDVKIIENGLECELSGCYNDSTLAKYTRRIDLKNNLLSLVDNFVFTSEGEARLVFCACEPIKITNNTATFTRNGENAQLVFDDNLFDASTVETEYYTHQDNLSIAYFLYLTSKLKAKSIEFKATIK